MNPHESFAETDALLRSVASLTHWAHQRGRSLRLIRIHSVAF